MVDANYMAVVVAQKNELCILVVDVMMGMAVNQYDFDVFV